MIAETARLFGATPGVAMRTGIGAAQAGEFGFVLLNLILDRHLVDSTLLQAILASMLLSMLAAPFLIQNADRIVMRLSSTEWMQQSLQMTRIATQSLKQRGHVIICGYGRAGQNLARMLEQEGISYVALDLDPDRVSAAAAAGESVVFGDAARRESLLAAGIHRAAAVAITYANTPSALRVLHHVHELEPTLPAIVRTVDDADLEAACGRCDRGDSGDRRGQPDARVAHAGAGRCADAQGRAARRGDARRTLQPAARLFPRRGRRGRRRPRAGAATIGAGRCARGRGRAFAGRTGAVCTRAEVTAIRRHGIRGVEPDPQTKLRASDIVVLRGLPEALALAEERLSRHRREPPAAAA